MLSQFQIFYLNKILSETYNKYYIPYFTLNEMAKARSKTVSAKGGNIMPTKEDHDFVSRLTSNGVDASKALMLYYQLLGNGVHAVKEKPSEPEGPKNKTFAWIEEKTDPDENGNIQAVISIRGSGRYLTKKQIKTTVNINSLKSRLKAAGYDVNNSEQLQSFLHTPLFTWRKRISQDKDAPDGASNSFVIKSFGGDYHATQVAASADFKHKMDSDSEFAKKVSEMAVRAASRATGVSVSNVKGLNYSANSKGNNGLSSSDLDDAIQAAIFYMSSQSATSPEKLNDDDWLRQKLSTGAMNHVKSLTVTGRKDRGMGDKDSEKGGSFDSVSEKGWRPIDVDDPDRYSGPPPEDPEGYVPPFKSSADEVDDIEELEQELKNIKSLLKDARVTGKRRSNLMRHGIEIEDRIELAKSEKNKIGVMNRYNKPKTPVVFPRKSVADIPDVKPNAGGWSMGHDNDDVADQEDMLKYRRRMSAESLTFNNYLKLKEAMGATSAIYDGSKSKDFQWEGNPKSMRKVRKK